MEKTNTRQYLLVDTSKTMSGIEVPRIVYWLDGRQWEVDSVQFIKPVPKSMDGATCFTVIIAADEQTSTKTTADGTFIPKEKLTDGDIEEMHKKRVLVSSPDAIGDDEVNKAYVTVDCKKSVRYRETVGNILAGRKTLENITSASPDRSGKR